ncbi:Bacterial extracellular solute-binding protein, family 5 Middle [Bifidobacterium ramosum]|nr:Bacterial extracellular solute-binding protein, family 5 Middle [Bifidobacterium ramosum]
MYPPQRRTTLRSAIVTKEKEPFIMSLLSTSRARTAGLAAVLALSLGLAGCGAVPDDNSSSAASQDSTTPVSGGVLRFGTKDEPGNGGLDPMIASVYASTSILNQIYDTLIVKGDDGQFEPSLATEWKQVDDTTYDFTLRQGVKFADGSDLTPSDVIWSFNYVKEKSPQSKAAVLKNLTNVTDKGGNVIEFKFSQPTPSFLNTVGDRLSGFYIVDQQWYEKTSEADRQKTSNGTGPFALEAWNKGKDVKLTRNTHYWEKGKPYLDGIDFVKVADENALLALVQQGQADAAWFWKPELAEQAKSNGLTLGKLQQTSTRFLFIDPNYDDGTLNNIKVRQALSKAIDRDAIIKIGTSGRGAKTFANPPAVAGLDTPTDETPNTKYDPDGAKKLLAESGDPNPTISLAYGADTADAPVFELMKDQLSKVGITLELKPVPYEEIQGIFTTGDKYMADLVLVQDVIGADPASAFTWWLTTGSNVDRWGDNEQAASAKELLGKIETNADDTSRVKQINELNNLIAEQVLALTPFATPLDYQVWSSKVHGYQTDPGDSRYHFKDTWLSK